MDHLSISDVDAYMGSVAHNVSRLRAADRHAASSLRLGCPGKGNPGHRMAVLDKSGTVKCHACCRAAVYIGNSQLAVSRVYDRLGGRGVPAGCTAGR